MSKKKIIISVSAVGAVLLFLLFWLNGWYIEMESEDVTVEVFSEEEIPGARACLKGRCLFKEGIGLDVTVEGAYDPDTIGEYEVSYSAGVLWLKAESALQTITVIDSVPPVITLVETEGNYTLPGRTYEEEGYTAADDYDGDLTDRVIRRSDGKVVTYTVSDSSGNTASVTRTIVYDDPLPPEITLEGGEELAWEQYRRFVEPGYTCTDNADGDLTDLVEVTYPEDFDPDVLGDYECIYRAEDAYGNVSEAIRTVHVVKRDYTPCCEIEDSGAKVVYLTFDDGPGAATKKLLKILDEYGVKATFFVVNSDYAYLIKEEYEAGHTVALHSYTHDYAIYTSAETYYEDLYAIQDVVYEYTGTRPTLIRFPGGSSNTSSKQYSEGIMTFLTEDVEAQGFTYFDWNVSTGDGVQNTTESVLNRAIEGMKNHRRSVILMHDYRSTTVAAVEEIIIWGLDHGYTFLPMDDTSFTAHQRVFN